MSPAVIASGVSSSVPMMARTAVPNERMVPVVQAFESDMSMVCSGARWDRVQRAPSQSPPHTTSLPAPQVVAGQRAQTSSDSYRGPRGVMPAKREVVRCDGKVTPTRGVKCARGILGEVEWLKRGRALLEISAALAKGQSSSLRKMGDQYDIPASSMKRLCRRRRLTKFAQAWANEVRELEMSQEAARFGVSQNPAREVLPAPVVEAVAVDDGHLTTVSLSQFQGTLPRDSNFAWGHLLGGGFVPSQPRLPSFYETFGGVRR